jgi:hypothetical protein
VEGVRVCGVDGVTEMGDDDYRPGLVDGTKIHVC